MRLSDKCDVWSTYNLEHYKVLSLPKDKVQSVIIFGSSHQSLIMLPWMLWKLIVIITTNFSHIKKLHKLCERSLNATNFEWCCNELKNSQLLLLKIFEAQLFQNTSKKANKKVVCMNHLLKFVAFCFEKLSPKV